MATIMTTTVINVLFKRSTWGNCSKLLFESRACMLRLLYLVAFFFFQAEDGIRDDLVTGVQTCALPISGAVAVHGCKQDFSCPALLRFAHPFQSFSACGLAASGDPYFCGIWISRATFRSEERRVGKECRSRWSRDDEIKKVKREATDM